MDRVQLIKQESAALGGDAADDLPFDAPIEPQEDAIEAAGVFLQDITHRDENVLLSRSGDAMTFKDVENPTPVTLSDLIAGAGGITEAGHRTLRQLIHLADEGGPFEGFASGAYCEQTPSGDPFPTSMIWWTSSGKTQKIVEETITYNSNKTIATDQWKVYDTDGSTVLATVTDTISYSGVVETNRTRVIA